MDLIIKKGRISIFHFPVLLKFSTRYAAEIEITESMFYTDDSCRPGWSKLWGISLGHIHWNNSYRFVYRIVNGSLWIGYYAYIGGVSPQMNTGYKGVLIKDVKVGDKLSFEVFFETSGVIMKLINSDSNFKVTLPSPTGFVFPITKCFPNIKCPIDRDIIYRFK